VSGYRADLRVFRKIADLGLSAAYWCVSAGLQYFGEQDGLRR
jgi:hypothetical protein